MSEPSGAAQRGPVSVDPDARIWTVDVDGNSYGPYSLVQLSRYLSENRVRAQSALSSPQFPGQKWTVAEVLATLTGQAPATMPVAAPTASPTPARPSGGAPHIPERDAEITKTLSRPVLTEARPEDDPATGLFDVLQTVREQKPAPRITSISPQVVGVTKNTQARAQGWKQPQRIMILGAIALVVISSMAVMLRWLKASGNNLDQVAEQHITANGGPAGRPAVGGPAPASAGLATHPVAAPVSTAPTIPQNRPTFKPAPRLVMPAVMPRTPTSTPISAPTQQLTTAEHDRRDARDVDPRDPRDLRDANAARDPRDFRDSRDSRNSENPDSRDPRDPRFRDFREETAMPPGVDPNVQNVPNPMNGPNGLHGINPQIEEQNNNPNR